jgi:hypothetical protein
MLFLCVLVAASAEGQVSTAQTGSRGETQADKSATPTKRVKGYSIILLVGEPQGSSMPENLPAPARKALLDIKDFLPFKSFRFIDEQWVAGSNDRNGAVRRGFIGTPDQQSPFRFDLETSPLPTKFALWSADGRQVLLDTPFTEVVGQTVVLGTSKYQADRALVVLLTIVPE